jgi:hypothetical protein
MAASIATLGPASAGPVAIMKPTDSCWNPARLEAWGGYWGEFQTIRALIIEQRTMTTR